MEVPAIHLAFRQVEQTHRQKLLDAFLAEPSNKKVADLMKRAKKGIRLCLSECDLPGVYIVMVRGSHDGILIKLGRECKMPRGFPVLWIPSAGFVRYFGFLPKFSNDERQIAEEVSTEYAGLESIRFFKKWSGFLGQLLVFAHNGSRYYTICSKNSADATSEFIQNAKRLFDPFITRPLVDAMIQRNLHICAEVMSKTDQTHGARVLRETPVVTVIGQPSATGDFVDFLTHSQVVEFCVRFGLPCDSAITFTGTDCLKFLQQLSNDRDFMDNDTVDRLIQSMPTAKIERGTVDHRDILGSRLEGLVFFLTSKNGSTTTKKFKFPGYTIRTMLFRPELESGPFRLHAGLKNKAENFVDFWCVSDAGRQYWLNKALEGFLLLHSGFKGTPELVADGVRLHIEVGDHIERTAGSNKLLEFDEQAAKNTNGTIVVVVGPIGFGKTTIMNQLCQAFPGVTVPIDGDVLGLSMDTTMNLKGERNAYSLWKITEALMQGRVPVFSTGGGVLMKTGKKQALLVRDAIFSVLGAYVNVVVLIPALRQSGDIVAEIPTPEALEELYDQFETVKSVVKHRVAKGIWTVPSAYSGKKGVDQFANFIAGKSKLNKHFADILTSSANNCFTFPALAKPGPAPRFDFNSLKLKLKLKDLIVPCRNAPLDGSFEQIRILVNVRAKNGDRICMGHVTMLYDESRANRFDLVALRKVANLGNGHGFGRKYDLKGLKGISISVAIPDQQFLPDGRTHITINPGPHEAKEMVHVAQAIFKGEASVTIGTVVYDIVKDDYTPVALDYLDIFGI